MKTLFILGFILISGGLAGCGTQVPALFDDNPDQEPIHVADLIQHVKCELKYSVQSVILEDLETASARAKLEERFPKLKQGRAIAWFDHFVAELTYNLTVADTGALNINAAAINTLPTMQNATVSLAGELSSAATRKETLSLFVDFNQFSTKDALAEAAKEQEKNHGANYCSQPGTPFIQGDLKLREWLEDALLQANADDTFATSLLGAEIANKKDVIQHEITFVITKNGNITPSLKLVNVTVDQGNQPFLSAQRVNTQDVIITIGPRTDDKLNAIALNALLAAQNRNTNHGQ